MENTNSNQRVRLRVECFPPCSKAQDLLDQLQESYLPWTDPENRVHYDLLKYRALKTVEKFEREFPGFKFSVKTEYAS